MARDDDLRRRIEIDGLDHFALGSLLAGGTHGVVVQAEHRRHGAGAHRHRGLHGVGAHAHQAHGIFQRQRAGGRQRGVFAQAMAGHHLGHGPARRAPGGKAGRAGGQHGRLGVGGEIELLGRALRHQGAQVLAQRGAGTRHDVGHGGIAGPCIEHADRLGALTGKDKRQLHDCP